MLFPITFSIPEEKIYNDYDKGYIKKEKVLSSLIPGDLKTYIYNTEKEYYHEYRISYFAITVKKSGWDCLRHYEIIANGCIPYFLNIEECPKNTMALLPKDLLIEANKLYLNKFENKTIIELTEQDINEYNVLQKKIIDYTKNHLTTQKIASYILEKTNFQNAKKILVLSGNTDTDYLRCLTLHGFKKLLGNKCHDYPRVPHIYKSNQICCKNLYGKGFSYSKLLDDNYKIKDLNKNVRKNIQNKMYDLVIYGSFHRGMPFYNLVRKNYNPNQIILLCGEDIHYCNHKDFEDIGHTVFVREME